MKIGIFDSGMGGISVLYEALKQLPEADYIYYGDSKNAPYGIKTKEEVIELCTYICDYLVEAGVDGIVVACNTATSAAIQILRNRYTIPIIGIEPALKPAVMHNSGKGIAVMATSMTLKEKKFDALMKKVASDYKVYKVPAPKIVELVESDKIDSKHLEPVIKEYFAEIKNSVESVVLGCTHFIFVKSYIQNVLGKDICLFDGNEGTIKQLIKKIDRNDNRAKGHVEIINSAGDDMVKLSYKLLEKLEAENGN